MSYCIRCAAMIPPDDLGPYCMACAKKDDPCADMPGYRRLDAGELIHKGDKCKPWFAEHHPDGTAKAVLAREFRDAVRTVGMRVEPWMVPHYRRVA